MKNSRCLVSGAGGFIGKHLVKRLLDEGSYVTSVFHKCGTFIGPVSQSIFHHIDLTQKVDNIFKGNRYDYVFHLAEKTGGILTKVNPTIDVRDNLTMALNMMDACQTYGVGKLILLTGTTGYSDYGDNPIKEWARFLDQPAEPYKVVGKVKNIIEDLSLLYDKVNTVILRPTSVYGPHDNFGENCHIIPKLIKDICSSNGKNQIQIYGDGTEKRDFIYIDDLIEAILLSVDKVNNPLNIGYGHSYSINKVIDIIGKITDSYPIIKHLEPKIPSISRVINSNKSQEILGQYIKTSLEEGLRKTIEWYKNERTF